MNQEPWVRGPDTAAEAHRYVIAGWALRRNGSRPI